MDRRTVRLSASILIGALVGAFCGIIYAFLNFSTSHSFEWVGLALGSERPAEVRDLFTAGGVFGAILGAFAGYLAELLRRITDTHT